MTSHTARLYALVGSVLVFFVAWAAIAARPWGTKTRTAAPTREVAALQARERRLRAESLAVRRIVEQRWAVYRAQLALRRQEIKAIRSAGGTTGVAAPASAPGPARAPSPIQTAPSVRVVTLPPLTITRTS